MNSGIKLVVLLLFFSCSTDKKVTPQDPAKPYDNALSATWKLVSVITNTGTMTTNPTNKEILTTFAKDTNMLAFENSGSMGGGRYTLKSGNGINISIQRGDFGGWPNGPWLDLYLVNMNRSSSYQFVETQLRIKTSEGSTLLFNKQ